MLLLVSFPQPKYALRTILYQACITTNFQFQDVDYVRYSHASWIATVFLLFDKVNSKINHYNKQLGTRAFQILQLCTVAHFAVRYFKQSNIVNNTADGVVELNLCIPLETEFKRKTSGSNPVFHLASVIIDVTLALRHKQNVKINFVVNGDNCKITSSNKRLYLIVIFICLKLIHCKKLYRFSIQFLISGYGSL